MTTLPARPEAITFAPQQSALIVVDMQNAYATPGGYLDLAGFDVSTTRPVIENIHTAVTAAREAGMLIIWFQNGWDEQYVEAGGPGSPNYHKSNALKTMRKRPELQGKLLAKGSWDYQLVDELVPQPGDIVLPKPRYSGFSTPRWTASCVAGAFVIWSLPESRPTSAWSRPCATAFSSNISALCWRTRPTRRALHLRKRPRCSISKPFWLGQRCRKLLPCPFTRHTRPYRLRSHACLNPSLSRQAPAPPSPRLCRAPLPMAWSMSPVPCRLISRITWSIPTTQRGKPATCSRPSKALSRRRVAPWRM